MLQSYCEAVLFYLAEHGSKDTKVILNELKIPSSNCNYIETVLTTNQLAVITKSGLLITKKGLAYVEENNLVRPAFNTESNETKASSAVSKKSTTLSGRTWPDIVNELLSLVPSWTKVIIGLVVLFFIGLYFFKDLIVLPEKNSSCKTWTIVGQVVDPNGQEINGKNIKIGVMSWPFTYDNKVVNGAFRITGVVLPKDNFLQVYIATPNGKQFVVYKQPLQDNKHGIDSINCTITFFEPIEFNYQGLDLNPQKKDIKKISFRIGKLSCVNLESLLMKDGYQKTTKTPTFLIDFEYSGKIEKMHSHNLFRYNGGYIRMFINGLECQIFDTIKLPATFNMGNSYEYVDSFIDESMRDLINKNTEVFYNSLKKCL